jgi:hypothetical protein
MVKKLLLGSLIAGFAMFMWGFVSWMALSWHQPRSVKNEQAVLEVLKANVTEHGLYMVPGALNADGSHKSEEEWMKQTAAGPVMSGVIRPGANHRSMASYMGWGFATQWFCALLVGLMISRVPMPYPCIIKLCAMLGVLITAVNHLPNINWYDFPVNDIWPFLVDNVVTMTLAGAILGRFVGGSGASCSR